MDRLMIKIDSNKIIIYTILLFSLCLFPQLGLAQDLGSIVDKHTNNILQFITGPFATFICVVGIGGGVVNIVWSQGQNIKFFLIVFASGVALFMLDKIIAGMKALGKS